MNDLSRREFRRICIIKPSSPGDIIHALPILRGLRRRYPNAHLAWLVASSFANLIEADPSLDEVVPFDRKRYGRIGRSVSATRDFVRFVRDLNRRRFDLIIDLQGLFRSGFLSLASGAAVRIGFRRSCEFAWLFYNHRIPRGPTDSHAADNNLAVGRMLGFTAADNSGEGAERPDFRIALTDEDRQAVDALFAETGIRTAPREEIAYAVLVPATRWETKCWPAERYGLLARTIMERHGLPSILVGGKSDVAAGEQALRASDGAAHNLCGRTTLRQLAALIDRAAVVVTADSTPMHMAAAHGRPLVALFGPTNPRRTGPYGRLDDVLRLDLDCSPCYLRKLRQCPFDHACMKDLEVERVAEAVNHRWKSTRGR